MYRFSFFILISSLMSFTTAENTFAETQLTENEKIQVLQPNLKFSDIAKNADGSIRRMNHTDATDYCSKQGARLPSARELAQLSMSLGAKGIVANCDSSKINCTLVRGQNADGSLDFYFNYWGYERPAGDLGDNQFWSSSVVFADFPFTAYILDGFNGYIGSVWRSDYYAVRCVSDR